MWRCRLRKEVAKKHKNLNEEAAASHTVGQQADNTVNINMHLVQIMRTHVCTHTRGSTTLPNIHCFLSSLTGFCYYV